MNMSEHEHIHCSELLGSLSDYIDGVASEALCQEIETHMASCENCRVVVDTLRKTITLYHTLGEETPEISSTARERLYRTLNMEKFL